MDIEKPHSIMAPVGSAFLAEADILLLTKQGHLMQAAHVLASLRAWRSWPRRREAHSRFV